MNITGTNVQNNLQNLNDLDINIVSPEVLIQETLKLYADGMPRGLELGIKSLDEVFCFSLSNLTIVTGIPNQGKSEFSDFVISQLNKRYGYKAGIYSPENQLINFHLAKFVSKFTNKQFDKSVITESELSDTITYLSKNFFVFDYRKNHSLTEILETAQNLIDTQDIKVLVLDSWNEIEVLKPDGMLDTEWVGKVLYKLVQFSRDNNILVLLVAHTVKMTIDTTTKDYLVPNSYSINGSAHFYGKADNIVVIQKMVDSFETIVKIDKVRFKNYGSQKQIKVNYDTDSGNYFDLSEPIIYGTNKPATLLQPFVIPINDNTNKSVIDYLNVEVDLYDRMLGKTHTSINLKEYLTTDIYKPVVEFIRGEDVNDEDSSKERKNLLIQNYEGYNGMLLPCVPISARFINRHEHTDLKEYTSLISIDIDMQDNRDIIDRVPEILKSISNVVFFGKSVRGLGFFAIIPIKYKDKVKEHYFALERDFKEHYCITLDNRCKDFTRLRFASYDPNYWINTNYVELYRKTAKALNKEVKAKTKEKTDTDTDNKIDVDKILSDCQKNGIDITNNYDNWNKVCLSLLSEYKTDTDKARAYFHKFSELSDKYDKIECNDQFDKLVDKYKDSNKVSVKSLQYLYKTCKNDL
ncbi:hypothetical protein EZS27_022650 [termite gut metagenome]|uniref:SF4 helicase domain-containing protein n=1 Tax=termite gut metagenome TaxID=433724 RepID=A0A5J4R741_9ZZZZ